jgi:DNA-binding CsgD family transcriptional regulator
MASKNITNGVKREAGVLQKETKVYWLGPKHAGVYFSYREAQCMAHLLRGRTASKIAAAMRLSPRTIECYVKNMKAKLGCRTKFELIELVTGSEFMKNARNLNIFLF